MNLQEGYTLSGATISTVCYLPPHVTARRLPGTALHGLALPKTRLPAPRCVGRHARLRGRFTTASRSSRARMGTAAFMSRILHLGHTLMNSARQNTARAALTLQGYALGTQEDADRTKPHCTHATLHARPNTCRQYPVACLRLLFISAADWGRYTPHDAAFAQLATPADLPDGVAFGTDAVSSTLSLPHVAFTALH